MGPRTSSCFKNITLLLTITLSFLALIFDLPQFSIEIFDPFFESSALSFAFVLLLKSTALLSFPSLYLLCKFLTCFLKSRGQIRNFPCLTSLSFVSTFANILVYHSLRFNSSIAQRSKFPLL
ncbi:uncharacterized protein AFUA_2G06270 [Aspergillus fumigatus Af293]|uniref:Uncharacterized protein n=2 Tax=Aspergillus fumigatus TaxID=746128 RepID=Q4WH87_ASPFU|nr:hypothetical protein AFUA_2G06270 [Aspergillus fumigatus Af293]EAL87718.1 hypothetical protein AFUA_2G06270 [Aspergillus fumigatus Af293]EDP54279.1 hypothetical protein AFUB_023350 [Aspergillus fumigatus A1163]